MEDGRGVVGERGLEESWRKETAIRSRQGGRTVVIRLDQLSDRLYRSP
jgi:hypothetical protein